MDKSSKIILYWEESNYDICLYRLFPSENEQYFPAYTAIDIGKSRITGDTIYQVHFYASKHFPINDEIPYNKGFRKVKEFKEVSDAIDYCNKYFSKFDDIKILTEEELQKLNLLK